jgi:hypothetical protein
MKSFGRLAFSSHINPLFIPNISGRSIVMKKLFTLLYVAAMVALFTTPAQLFAQAGDTVYLPADPTGLALDGQIKADPNWGTNPNLVYVLQQTGSIDTAYFINSDFQVKYNLTIIGKPNPITGMLPVIAPGFDASGASPKRLFQPNVTGVHLTLKNLYITDKNINGVVATPGFGSIYATGDSVTMTIDRCILDGSGVASFIYLNAKWDKLFVTNTELRNAQTFTAGQGGFIHYGGTPPADTMIVRNSTMFCNNGKGLGGPGYHAYVEYDHNTIFFSGSPAIDLAGLTNGVITNNIFYGVYFRGTDSTNYVRQTYEGSYASNQVCALDSLSATVLAYVPSEADRHIRLQNNAYFWPIDLMNYIKTLKSDTGTTITPPVWMNKRVTAMFTDKNEWPNCLAINNDSVDPGFDASLVTPVVDSLKVFVHDYWNGGGTSSVQWGVYKNDPLSIYLIPGHEVPSDWATHQGYPVPENLRYTNSALYYAGTDGKALGDLNWFPEQMNATPPPIPTIASPSGATNVARLTTFTWNASNGATGYRVQVATDSTFTSIVTDTTVSGTNVKQGTPLAASTVHYWHVAASDNIFTTAFSATASFTTGTSLDAVIGTGALPKEFALLQNYPNPFNPTTVIRYDVPKSSDVSIKVFDVLGREVATLVDARLAAGKYSVEFNAARMASGAYFLRMSADNYLKIQRMMLLK